jgi:transketolase
VSARVVSMPCWELFAVQDAAYREQVLPRARWQRVSVEAGVTLGWREYVGDRGACVGVDRFGASAPGEVLMEQLGVTPGAVVAAAQRVIASA